MDEKPYYAEEQSSTISGGLNRITERDRSTIEMRVDNLSKELSALGEDTSRFINRVSMVRRIAPTTETELSAKETQEEHASELAIRLAQLSKQALRIQAMVNNALDELEV